LTLLVGRQEGHPTCKNGRWWRWALVGPDGVAPSQIVGVSASVNLPLHRKVQKFFSGTGSPGWSRKKGLKTVVWWCGMALISLDVKGPASLTHKLSKWVIYTLQGCSLFKLQFEVTLLSCFITAHYQQNAASMRLGVGNKMPADHRMCKTEADNLNVENSKAQYAVPEV